MIVDSSVYFLEDILYYKFRDASLGAQSLITADRDREDPSIRTDGNRQQASFGGMILELVLYDICSTEYGNRAKAFEDVRSAAAFQNLANIAVRSKINKLIKSSPRQGNYVSDKVLGITIKAIIGAVWFDTNRNYEETKSVVKQLVKYKDATTQDMLALPTNDNAVEQTVDPSLLLLDSSASEVSGASESLQLCQPDMMDFEVSEDVARSDTLLYGLNQDMRMQSPNWNITLEVPQVSHDLYWTSQIATIGRHYHTIQVEARLSEMPSGPTTSHEIYCNPVEEAESTRIRSGNAPKAAQANMPRTKLNSGRVERRNSPKTSTERQVDDANLKLEKFFKNEIAKWRCEESIHPTYSYWDSYEFLKQSIMQSSLISNDNLIRHLFLVLMSYIPLIYLKEALRHHRRTPIKQNQNHSLRLSPANRFNLISQFCNEEANRTLLRRYHVLQLYIDCLDPYSAEAQTGFIHNNIQKEKGSKHGIIGNPVNLAKQKTTNTMVRKVFPEVERSDYSKRQNQIKPLRQLGEALYILTSGGENLGVLALLPASVSTSGVNSFFCLPDPCLISAHAPDLHHLINHLKQHTSGFEQFNAAANEILQFILNNDVDQSKCFMLEHATIEEIEAKPAGSHELLDYLIPV